MAYNGEIISQIERDAFGRETTRHQGAFSIHTEYDPAGRLAKQTSTNQLNKTQGPIQREYGYNAFGNISQLTEGTGDGQTQTRYVYDLINRLERVEGDHPETFDFDPASNLLSTSQNNDSQKNQSKADGNRLLMQGDKKFTYDKRGNLIQENRGKDGKLVTRYTYNANNQLVQLDKNGQTTRYTYDPLGRRTTKQDEFGTTHYHWAGDQLTQETRGQQTKTYIYEPNSFKPVALVQNEDLYHYHLDHLGTPKHLSNSAGNIVWQARYQTYGNAAVKEDENADSIENNLRFQGQYFDEESGLHYNRHRYYDPRVGQFTQQDPIGLLGGVNNYQYVPNPVQWVDPLGLSAKPEDCPTVANSNSPITDPSQLISASKWATPEHPDFPIKTFVTTEDMYFEQAIDASYQVDKITGNVKPGGFFTGANTINDERYLRNDLAVTHEMKAQVTHVAVFKFPAGIRLQKSIINPQTDLDGTYLTGGKPQVEVLNYEDRSRLQLDSVRELKK